jgi:hypothetical protein
VAILKYDVVLPPGVLCQQCVVQVREAFKRANLG